MSTRYEHPTSKDTPYKQSNFQYMLEILVPMWRGIRKRYFGGWWKDPLFYVDLNAGAGYGKDGTPGSPVIFKQIMSQVDLPVNAHFYECNPDTFQKLERNMQGSGYTLHCADNSTILAQLPNVPDRSTYGLVYFDPTVAPLLDIFNLASSISARCRKVDLLINFPATTWKRIKHEVEGWERASNLIQKIHKGKCLVRRPYKQHQWTMLFFTNYLDFPEMEKREWFDIKTPMGRKCLSKIDYSESELRDQGQPPLFDL